MKRGASSESSEEEDDDSSEEDEAIPPTKKGKKGAGKQEAGKGLDTGCLYSPLYKRQTCLHSYTQFPCVGM